MGRVGHVSVYIVSACIVSVCLFVCLSLGANPITHPSWIPLALKVRGVIGCRATLNSHHYGYRVTTEPHWEPPDTLSLCFISCTLSVALSWQRDRPVIVCRFWYCICCCLFSVCYYLITLKPVRVRAHMIQNNKGFLPGSPTV